MKKEAHDYRIEEYALKFGKLLGELTKDIKDPADQFHLHMSFISYLLTVTMQTYIKQEYLDKKIENIELLCKHVKQTLIALNSN